MSFLQSIMGGFSSNSGQGQPSNQNQGGQQNQQQSQGNGSPQGNGQPTDSNASPASPNQQVNGSNTPVDPSELWNKMWDTTNNGEKADTPPQLKLDSTILDQVSGKLDLMQGIDQELLQKATSGDTQALLQIIQNVGRSAYKNAISHNSSLTNEFIGQREAFQGKQLPGMIKGQMTNDLLAGEGAQAPAFVKNQMQDLAKRFQQANPDATPAQVKQSVQDYVRQLAEFVNPGQNSTSNNQQQNPSDQQTDWDKWLG
jgi:hypothetical protein